MAWGPDRVGGYATDHVLIKLAPGARLALDAGGVAVAFDRTGAVDWQVTQVLRSAGVTSVASASTVLPANVLVAASLGMDRWMMARVPAGTDTPALTAQLHWAGRNARTLQVAEVDGIGQAAADAEQPDDTYYLLQWGLENTGQDVNGVSGTPGMDVRARAAWHVSVGSPSTVVAVVDSGVNLHQDLADRVLPGWNIVNQSADTTDFCSSHGTHVAGILAASGSNATDVAGMAWNVKILPVVVLNPCTGQSAWLADGITWAVDHGADIINMSLQYTVGTQYLRDAVLYAAAADVPMVAATGNNPSFGVTYPAKWEEVIAVSSLASDGSTPSTSSTGPETDIAAPGAGVLSLVNTTEVDFKNGTSMACPHVAGAVALMHSVAPALSAGQLRTALLNTCRDVQAPGFDTATGYGMLDAGAAVRAARELVGVADLDQSGTVDGTDLGLLLGSWGGCGTPCPADLNDDGVVDGTDLGLLLGSWGSAS